MRSVLQCPFNNMFPENMVRDGTLLVALIDGWVLVMQLCIEEMN